MPAPLTFLVLGATGGTGKHFVSLALADGHRVRALVRTPSKLPSPVPAGLECVAGSLTDDAVDVDALVRGVDYVACFIGDREVQQHAQIAAPFIRRLVPAMRRGNVRRLLYQAGGLSKPYGGQLTWLLWILRKTVARGFNGQHEDNEAVMAYLATEAEDVEWIVHRAGIYGDGASKGTLERSSKQFSIAPFGDCAAYSYKLVKDDAAVHTSDFSHYKS